MSETTDVRLLPCPFCSAPAQLHSGRVAEDAEAAFVRCSECRVATDEFEDAYAPVGQAIAAWNRRAALDAALTPSEDVAGCEWCVDGLQADGETPCPCQTEDLPRQIRDLKRAIAERDEQITSLSAKLAAVERERDEAETERTDMMWQRRRAEETAKAAEGRAPEMQQEVERLQSVILRAADILYHNLGRQDEKVRDVEPLLRAALQQEGESDA